MATMTKRAMVASHKKLLTEKPLDKITITDITDSRATWQEGYIAVFEEIKRDAPFVLNVYRSVSHDKLEDYLHKVCFDLLYAVVEEESQGTKAREEDKIFVANLYKYAFVGLVLDWIRTGMKEEPAVIVAKLSAVMEGRFRQALVALGEKN